MYFIANSVYVLYINTHIRATQVPIRLNVTSTKNEHVPVCVYVTHSSWLNFFVTFILAEKNYLFFAILPFHELTKWFSCFIRMLVCIFFHNHGIIVNSSFGDIPRLASMNLWILIIISKNKNKILCRWIGKYTQILLIHLNPKWHQQ